MEDKVKAMDRFRKAVKKYKEDNEVKRETRQANIFAKMNKDVLSIVLEKFGSRGAETNQLVKAKPPPNWSGQ